MTVLLKEHRRAAGPRVLARVCRVIGVFHSLAQSADTVELVF